ncbi:MAG: CaiB/BaiF CoA-transferase family protein [Conexivisphaerales archaeon]
MLEGVKVIDTSRLLPGGFCSMILQELGAEVIKVEEPGVGDYMRLAPPFVKGSSLFHRIINKNKKSIAINLKKDKGKEILGRLISDSDVFIEGFRPGVMRKLGFSFEDVKLINDRIVYCSISGFGHKSKLSRIPGHDLTFEAFSGLLSFSNTIPAVQLADISAGFYAAVGILASLAGGKRGVHIDVPIVQSLFSTMILPLALALADTKDEMLLGSDWFYSLYRTSDQKLIAIATIEDKFRKNLLRLLGVEGSRDALAKIFASAGRDEWMKRLMSKEVCFAPVLSVDEAIKMGYVKADSMGNMQFPLKQTIEKGSAPSIGENTSEILASLGYNRSEINELKQNGVVE